MARTDWIDPVELGHLLAALMPENRLALEISLATGMRIGDVLNMRTEVVRAAPDGRFGFRELKTGKKRRVRLPAELRERCLRYSGKIFVFEHRYTADRPRTKQAVWKDLKRVARAFRCKANIAPHSARKAWAVSKNSEVGLKRLQGLLGHSDEAVTVLYAYADELTRRKLKGRKPSALRP